MRRIGGRKQAGVDASAGQVTLDFLHVRVKADGEHAVGLVKDQFPQGFQIQSATQQMVQHTARRAHNELCAFAQGVHLLFVAHAAVDGRSADARAFKNGGGFAFYLNGQFPGGGQHQGLRGLELRREPGQHGQQVAAGFAAARAGLHHDIPTFQQIGQGQALHGHEALPAGAGAGRAHGLRQVVQGDAGQSVFRLADGDFFHILKLFCCFMRGFGLFRRRGLLYFACDVVRFGHVCSRRRVRLILEFLLTQQCATVCRGAQGPPQPLASCGCNDYNKAFYIDARL